MDSTPDGFFIDEVLVGLNFNSVYEMTLELCRHITGQILVYVVAAVVVAASAVAVVATAAASAAADVVNVVVVVVATAVGIIVLFILYTRFLRSLDTRRLGRL